MPAEREPLHRLDPLDEELQRHALVRLLQPRDLFIGGRGDYRPGQARTFDEGPVERNAEPAAELPVARDRPPDALARRVQLDRLFDAVGSHGCARAWRSAPRARRYLLN